MALYGIDESHYQATLIGQDFVILKATEGNSYVDPTCDIKYQANKAAGKLLGIYHFANFGDPIEEANFFVDNCVWYMGEALLALDIETTANVEWSRQWLDQVYSRTKVRPVIYMSASTANAADWSSVSSDYALWCAGYPARFDVPNPPTPAADGSDMPYNTGSWPYATIWQYTSSAGTLDRDIGYMDINGWHSFATGDRNNTPPPSDPTPPAPVITTQDVTTTKDVPFESKTIADPTKDVTYSEVSQQGVNGVETIVTRTTYSDGQPTGSEVISDTITTQPVVQITTVGSKPPTTTKPTDPTPTPVGQGWLGKFIAWIFSLFTKKNK
jgi:GH25 family lysozyme M1 (1,4-beta-N-acetylmuramidase)